MTRWRRCGVSARGAGAQTAARVALDTCSDFAELRAVIIDGYDEHHRSKTVSAVSSVPALDGSDTEPSDGGSRSPLSQLPLDSNRYTSTLPS